MRQMTIRGLKLFFRDKSGVFFSLLGVIIIFCLFVFFISDLATQGLDFLDNASYIMNSWMVAGMLASQLPQAWARMQLWSQTMKINA